MGFQKRLLLTYSLLVFLLVVILALLFYRYSSGLFEDNALETYGLLADKYSDQLDSVLKPMDFISTNLISDASFKSALASLDSISRSDPGNTAYLTEAEQTIRRQLYTYSIIKNFYALVVFTRQDDFYTSNFMEHTGIRAAQAAAERLDWIPEAVQAAGASITIAPQRDVWDAEGGTAVFGRGRAVPGLAGELGFIAVLNRAAELASIFEVPDSRFVRVRVFLPSGRRFYGNDAVSDREEAYYRSMAQGRTRFLAPNPFTGTRQAFVATTSGYTGITVLLVLDRRILLAPLGFARNLTIGIGALIILFSVVYNWISARLLTKPLRLIQSKMEDTGLDNLSGGMALEHPNDEIVALDRAFMGLRRRLDESIRRELDSRTLWMRARFDSLQAQVDPHFINNILTVIAGRALELGDERIGDICDGVASMLRYSTATTESWATVADELAHLRHYLFLMKQRLEDRLTYTIDVEPGILGARLPKIIFQQIAENSFVHGYGKTPGAIAIGVRGFAAADRWTVELTDNGNGFDPERLAALNEQLASIREDPGRGVLERGLAFGGLGLINTYARMYLFYQGDLYWKIENIEPRGARVLLGGPLVPAGGEG